MTSTFCLETICLSSLSTFLRITGDVRQVYIFQVFNNSFIIFSHVFTCFSLPMSMLHILRFYHGIILFLVAGFSTFGY